MKERYIVTIAECHQSQSIRDQNGEHLAFTEYLPHRATYGAILTRDQWDRLRNGYWSNPFNDGVYLVPDMEYVVDGQIFTDFNKAREASRIATIDSILGSLPALDESPQQTQGGLEPSEPHKLDEAGSNPAPASAGDDVEVTLEAQIIGVIAQAPGDFVTAGKIGKELGVTTAAVCLAVKESEMLTINASRVSLKQLTIK